MNWLKAGDKNTKFFHAVTKNRRAQSRIKSLTDEEGKECSAAKDLGRVAESYFKKLFASEDVGMDLQEWGDIPSLLRPAQNTALMAPITNEEVKKVVFDINPTKYPGPDGMNGYFFQPFWETSGEELTAMVQRFFESGELEEGMNNTNICLIPKILVAKSMSDYRPISLCNVAYKIVSKLMARRMKKVLPQVISETQAAFVEGRLISDNILVAHELLHALTSDNKCSSEFIAIKTDISKAYDRVEWAFLDRAMKAVGFSEAWRKLIMSCVSSVRYQVLINGEPFGRITPTRGLRQGDSLSPYLFVICTEVLVQLLKIAEHKQLISGLRVARRAPPVTHLLFADDSMLYCKGTDDEELNQVIHILQHYSLASGQRINYDKSMYFGKHIPTSKREEIKQKLGIVKTGGEGFYLGLPESVGGSKVALLSYLKENLNKRVHGWQTKFLSPAGKEVLLKAVAMALPTYTMACFLLPKTLCQQIMSILSDFWWRNSHESRGMHWKSWESLCKPKSGGGLGFKDLEAFNLALLGKQLWRMITNKNSLVTRIFRSRYFKTSDPLNALLGSRPSYAWRSIHAAQNLVQQGARVMLGNGKETKVWQDRWIGSKPALPVISGRRTGEEARGRISEDMRVSELLVGNGREWNHALLDNLFTQETSEQIKRLQPAGTKGADTYAWEYTKSGHYTVKSAYWVQVNEIAAKEQQPAVLQPSLDGIYQLVWSLETSPKVRHFLWRCLSNALPVAANMAHRHIAKDKRCIRCGAEAESVNHLLFQCSYARLIWAEANVHIPPAGVWSESFFSNLFWVLNLKKEYPKEEIEEGLIPWLLWRVWKNRNELLFRSKDYEAAATVMKAREDTEAWKCREEVKVKEVKRTTTEEINRKWIPPHPTRLKCNTDGSWKQETGEGEVGWVLRDHHGNMLWAEAKRITSMGSELEVEAEALRWVAYTLAGFGYRDVIFETDSQILSRMVRGEEEVWPRVYPVIQEISSSLTRFNEVEVVHYPRSGNKVADRIANETAACTSFVPKLYSMQNDSKTREIL